MKDHPLTPMRDSNLKRLMEAQSRYSCLEIGTSFSDSDRSGKEIQTPHYLIPDCRTEEDAKKIAETFGSMKLLTRGKWNCRTACTVFASVSSKKKTEVCIHSCLPEAAVSRQEGKLRNISKKGGKKYSDHTCDALRTRLEHRGILGKYQIRFIIRSCFGLFQRRAGTGKRGPGIIWRCIRTN